MGPSTAWVFEEVEGAFKASDKLESPLCYSGAASCGRDRVQCRLGPVSVRTVSDKVACP